MRFLSHKARICVNRWRGTSKGGQVVNKKHLTTCVFSFMIAKVMHMEQFFQRTLLYDFYGELLTERQRSVYEEVVLNDISYSEAAEDLGISRQGVHELIKRCNRILEDYESKLHLVERFLRIREKVEQIRAMAHSGKEKDPAAFAESVCEIADSILEEL